jgi:hypothetical protein
MVWMARCGYRILFNVSLCTAGATNRDFGTELPVLLGRLVQLSVRQISIAGRQLIRQKTRLVLRRGGR